MFFSILFLQTLGTGGKDKRSAEVQREAITASNEEAGLRICKLKATKGLFRC